MLQSNELRVDPEHVEVENENSLKWKRGLHLIFIYLKFI